MNLITETPKTNAKPQNTNPILTNYKTTQLKNSKNQTPKLTNTNSTNQQNSKNSKLVTP